MAIYHFYVKTMGRNEGRSAVAAAAYRAGTIMVNDYDGVKHDYRKKGSVVYSEVLLPGYAPREYTDREKLWNAVEMAERAKDARLCREVEIALPIELSRDQQIDLARNFVQKTFVDHGMCADFNIHDPVLTDDRGRPIHKDGTPMAKGEAVVRQNPHVHVLLTLRAIDPETGKWAAKTQAEYLCLKNGEEKPFAAEEYQTAREEGWEKQYLYYRGKKKVWLTAAEGRKQGLKRVNASAKCTRYGRENPVSAAWNQKDRIFDWRNGWANACNAALKAAGSDVRIDAGKKAGQGILDEMEPYTLSKIQLLMEKRADRLEREGKRGVRSWAGEINREIKQYNQIVRTMRKELAAFQKSIEEKIGVVRKRLEELRGNIIGSEYKILKIRKALPAEVRAQYGRILKCMEELQSYEQTMKEAEQQIQTAKGQLQQCGVWEVKRKSALRNEIQTKQETLETMEEIIKTIIQKYGYERIGQEGLHQYRKKLKSVERLLEEEAKARGKKHHDMLTFRRVFRRLNDTEKQMVITGDFVRKQYDERILKDRDSEMKMAIYNVDRELGLTKPETEEKPIHKITL